MLHIYLDQFAWIGLAGAAYDRPDGARYRDALDMYRAARVHNVASFPLEERVRESLGYEENFEYR